MKQLTDFVYEYEMTKEERDIINAINDQAQAEMLKFVGEHLMPKISELNPDKHTYKVRYNRQKGTVKFKRIEQHREITKSNFANELCWGE